MIESLKKNEGIQYQKLTPEEMKARGILGRLIGPCADFRRATRNGRKYSEKLWENVFADPIMQEKIKNGVCFGELGHPADRTETDMEKIAICLREQPKKNSEGLLLAVFDILDTPNGRILKTLCDYGSTLAVSSRGTGDIITDMNGDEAVDPDTYECECFDIVLVPGVESARLKYVTEGLDVNNLKMRQALCESFEKATEEEKEIMKETLDNLNIKLDEDVKQDEVCPECGKPVAECECHKEAPVEEAKKEEKEEPKEEAEEPAAEEAPVEEAPAETEEVVLSAEGEQPVVAEEPVEGEEAPVEGEDEAPAEEILTTEEGVEKTPEEIFWEYAQANLPHEQFCEICKALDHECPECEEGGEEGIEEVPAEEAGAEEEVPAEEAPVEGEEPVVEEPVEECNNESCADKEKESKQPIEEVKEAVNDGDDELLKGLQEALKTKTDLEAQVRELQEKLAVSDTEVSKLNEECSNYKEAAARLSEIASQKKELDKKVSSLEESLKTVNESLEAEKANVARLIKSKQNHLDETKTLTESVSAKEQAYTELNESFNKAKADYEDQIKALTEKLTESENSTSEKVKTLSENLTKQSSLTEGYKKLANKTMSKYIECKAAMLGVTASEIKSRLPENFNLDAVEKVCEDLKTYQLNINRLPFSLSGKVKSVKVNESANHRALPNDEFEDDDVDESLLKLSGLNY